jgi:hypothetical protein
VRAPAFLAALPRLYWRPHERYPLVADEVGSAAPALADDLATLERELLPDFYDLDEAAQRAQNGFRLGQVVVICGGGTATALGAVQAAMGGGVAAIGIAEALVAGALTGTVAYVRGRQARQEYYTSRLKAEQLRGEYFLFLGRIAPFDGDDADRRLASLRETVSTIVGEGAP